ncbi:acyl-CoA dehydrogenase [Leptolyngbya sp. FACHB-261]|uniref:acyl-CoA dehydrogenase n=1 Tax=Leptolyngbya sp. FACHB-261 TaxID=2692806 RepID=UPI0016895A47|nr:acyl-CoA dehydrogenase [Leptolyngbya sp. FACHB-261]MBD2102743.1 acyl-CoA dehydrogenase [Leptolyngbya sp. FACHB-261]
MHQLAQYQSAEALEQYLGDPCDTRNLLSFQHLIELDEREEFPAAEVASLYRWQLQDYHVPVELGGKFQSYEEFVAQVRVLSRRDLTTSITFTTLFWSGLVWMAGTDAQKQSLSQFIRDQDGAMCLAYSEKAHGSDLLASEVRAVKVLGGYLLSGEKWPINRATISGITFVLAQTDEAAGARSLSLFMVRKSELNPDNYSNLPKIKTHGIRGSDMSGIRFDHCFVSEESRLGPEGAGLELGLKGFQVTRTLCSAFSLGAADTALRTTLKFALNRQLYGKTVFDLPQPQRTLTDAFLDLLICDCVTIAAARGFHVVPEQFSVWSAVVKYFVPTTAETLVQNLSVVMGARFYLREAHDWGIFQKVVRDNAIISVFDGSTVVNLHALILQLRQLAKSRARRREQQMMALNSRLSVICSLTQPLPKFQPDKLELFSRGNDDILQGLELALAHLHGLQDDASINLVVGQITALAETLLALLNAQDEALLQSSFEHGHEQSPELFDLAKRYCTLHAAAACIQLWLHNRTELGEFFARGEWLVLSLHRLLKTIHPVQQSVPQAYYEPVTQQLLKLYTADQLFSIAPFQLAQSRPVEDEIHATTELQLQA